MVAVELHTVRLHPNGAQVVRVVRGATPGETVEIRGISASATAFYVKGPVKSTSVRTVLESPENVDVEVVRVLAKDCADFIKRSRVALSKNAALKAQHEALCSAMKQQAKATPHSGVAGYDKSLTSGFLRFADVATEKFVQLGGLQCESDGVIAELAAEERVLNDRIRRLMKSEDYEPQAEFEELVTRMEKKVPLLKLGGRRSQIMTLVLGQDATPDRELEVQYTVKGVTWVPCYNVLCQGSSEATIEYFADIENRSDEDWKDVMFSLERSRVEESCNTPQCPMQQVSIQKDEPNVMMHRKLARSAPRPQCLMAFAAPAVADCMEANECFGAAAPSENAGIAASFKLSQKATLMSTPGKQRILITRQQLEGYKAVHWVALENPGTSGQTYNANLVMHAMNSTGFEMLPAAVQLFVDGEFQGTNDITTAVRVNRPLSLCLGENQAITVVEQKSRELTQVTGILGNSAAKVHTVRYALKNTSDRPQTIFVVANCPVSTDTAAKVTLIKPELSKSDAEADSDLAATVMLDGVEKGAVRNAVTGNVVEKITIAAGAISRHVFEFAVSIPQGKDIKIVPV